MADLNTIGRAAVAIIGLFLSIYALHVEVSSFEDKDYKALCDINEYVSCTKVFNSKYGKGFGLVEPILGKYSILNLPNPFFGIVFYMLFFILCTCPHNILILKISTVGAGMSCVLSVYLAYILYLMTDVCVVCISMYVVNFSLLFLNYWKLGEAVALKQKSE